MRQVPQTNPPLTPLDVIIEEMKGCREQWLKTQSQLDHSGRDWFSSLGGLAGITHAGPP
jgi:hypothetical protein